MTQDPGVRRFEREDHTVTRRESPGRWPRWVYQCGQDPDYRFSFANERTFLAWLRTALALIAGGVALDAVQLSMPPGGQRALAAGLVAVGAVCAIAAWIRWAQAERAMRREESLPTSSPLMGMVAVLMVVCGVVPVAL